MSTADWQAKADWMRAVGATSATWLPIMHQTIVTDDRLVDLTLGPAPVAEAHETKTQQRLAPGEAEERARIERMRVASLSSGGPVRRGGSAE